MKLLRHLYVQVLIAVVLGSLFGYFEPHAGASLEPIGKAFVNLVKMLIGPIIFSSIVIGIGGIQDLKKVGRVGLKALVYFEVVTTVALLIGLVVVNVLQPGAGIHANASTFDTKSVSAYAKAGGELSTVGFLLNIIPSTFLGAFTSGEILQVLLIAVLTGVAGGRLGENGHPFLHLLEICFQTLMGIVGFLMKLAPLAAFGAMAFTIGKYGLVALLSLAKLMACVYLTMGVFVLLVLGGILRFNGFRLWPFLRHIGDEILLVLGTSSSESALPGLMAKMERLGCPRSIVGLVVPAGYSFNLDGTSIYLTMAAIFIAQATDTPLDIWQQLGILLILLLTSKGAAAVTGGGFITLSATLTSTPTVPIGGLTLLVGVDRFMSEARAITNLIGNAVAVVAVSCWEKELDKPAAQRVLDGLQVLAHEAPPPPHLD
jgi:aerobic C4-dicarboxylate transport protein